MIRTLFIGVLFSVLVGVTGVGAPATVYAQVCNPKCGPGESCAYEGLSGTKTVCFKAEQNGDLDEVVVTAAPKSNKTLRSIVENSVIPIGNSIIGLLFAVAFVFFILGVFKYFFIKGADPKSREEGKMFMIWGIIGLAVMFSVWGLVHLVINIIPT